MDNLSANDHDEIKCDCCPDDVEEFCLSLFIVYIVFFVIAFISVVFIIKMHRVTRKKAKIMLFCLMAILLSRIVYFSMYFFQD